VQVRTGSLLALLALFLAAFPAAPHATAEMPRGGEGGVLLGFVIPDEDLTGDDDSSTELTFGLRGGAIFTERWGWYIDGLYSDVSRDDIAGDATTYTGRMGLDFYLNRKNPRWFVTFAGGWTAVEFDNLSNLDFHRPLASAGFGQRLNLGGPKNLRWEIRGDHTLDDPGLNGEDMTNLYFVAGFIWGPRGTGGTRAVEQERMASGDADFDGVGDRKDRCPDTPAGATVDERGCPLDDDKDGVPDELDGCPDTVFGEPVGADGCPPDEDGDGVFDFTDVCPGTPAGASADEWGCPKDSDRDGVYNGLDECADTLWGARVDSKGCGIDSDGDGVFDGLDRCPDTPPDTSVDGRGCPLDSDGDGVDDLVDSCPDTPTGTPVDARGCPTLTDADGDGVTDDRDACPGTPAGSRVDARGCVVLFETGQRSLVLENVQFETGSARLTASSSGILDAVAASLAEWPDVRIEIGGHTDSSGSDELNRRLSGQRADSVRDYLIGKGVAADRLVSHGYGEDLPVADNSTADGMARNRRVELKRLD
jgi:outer membrane protein OmpA-like peptidoglycan-associated protein